MTSKPYTGVEVLIAMGLTICAVVLIIKGIRRCLTFRQFEQERLNLLDRERQNEKSEKKNKKKKKKENAKGKTK